MSQELQYYSCNKINNTVMNFSGSIYKENFVTFCCEPLKNLPGVSLFDKGEVTIKNFIKMRDAVIFESKEVKVECGCKVYEGQIYTKACVKCAQYRLGSWGKPKSLTPWINLSMYPSPCQSKCIYCNAHKNSSNYKFNQKDAEGYEKILDALNYARTRELIATNACWQISTGEITIHPYRDKIFDLVRDDKCIFYTNCFKFDKDIGNNLQINSKSCIQLSIDSGTPKTWHEIKGVDNFNIVVDNLVKYRSNSSGHWQIKLKYIVLPGINDTDEDYLGIIELLKSLGLKQLSLSRDIRLKYAIKEEQRHQLINAAGRLAIMLKKNNLTCDITEAFTQTERNNVESFSNELLASGKILG